MTRFVADLGDFQLTKEAQAQLADDIQKVALGYVARADIRADVAIRFPHEWLGIVIRENFDLLHGADKQIGERLGGF